MSENEFVNKKLVGEDESGRPIYETVDNVNEASKRVLQELDFVLSYFQHKQDQYKGDYNSQSYCIQKEIDIQKIKLDLLRLFADAGIL